MKMFSFSQNIFFVHELFFQKGIEKNLNTFVHRNSVLQDVLLAK